MDLDAERDDEVVDFSMGDRLSSRIERKVVSASPDENIEIFGQRE
jgi:hypothetical protein